MSNPIIDHLLARRSVVANALTEPGPTADQLDQILTAAARVPDQKKLVPWRFILFQGAAREVFGLVLATACEAEEDEPSAFRLEIEAKRFLRAPLVVVVISSVKRTAAVPEWEKVLSAGAACQNLVVAATALGCGAHGSPSGTPLADACRAPCSFETTSGSPPGFIYIGTATEAPEERARPPLDEIVTAWEA